MATQPNAFADFDDPRRRLTVHHRRVGAQRWETTSPDTSAIKFTSRKLSAAYERARVEGVKATRPELDDPVVLEHVLVGIENGLWNAYERARDEVRRARIEFDYIAEVLVDSLSDRLSIRDMAEVLEISVALVRKLDSEPKDPRWAQIDFEDHGLSRERGDYAWRQPEATPGNEIRTVNLLTCFDEVMDLIVKVPQELCIDDWRYVPYDREEALRVENPEWEGFRKEPWRVEFYDWVTATYTSPLPADLPARLRPRVSPAAWTPNRVYDIDWLVEAFDKGLLAQELGTQFAPTRQRLLEAKRPVVAEVHRFGPAGGDVSFTIRPATKKAASK